jgi:hypothetical protein
LLFIKAEAAPFYEILPTTWEEAERRQYVRIFAWQTYQFAEEGWLKGVEVLKLTDDATFAQRLSQLSATLRSYVTPRPQQERLVNIFQISKDSGLEHAFVYNVLSTRLIDKTFSQSGAFFLPNDNNKHIVVVPTGYGLRPLPR